MPSGDHVTVQGVSEVLDAHRDDWSPEQLSEFLLSFPATGAVWDWLSRLPDGVSRLYRKALQPVGLPDPAECERVAQELISHGRPFAALDLLGLYVERADPPPDPALIAAAMETAATSPSGERVGQLLQHHVARLLDHLESSNELEEARLAQLEWLYLPLLRYSDRPPRLLHSELARAPDFFADVVSQVYRGEGEERDDTPESRTRAQVGHQLLDSWHGLPGDGEGVVDSAALRDWVLRAREILHDRNRGAIGDQCIGNALRYSPNGIDGAWPHEGVRNLVEELESQRIETGIEVELSNSRGFTSRGMFEGGDQERQLAQQYQTWAEMVQTRWPRTAAMHRRIAEHFEWVARRHDDDAEQYEDG